MRDGPIVKQDCGEKELRGVILARFDSESALARSLGWTRQRLNRMTQGHKKPNLSEARAICEKLEVSMEELAVFFH